MPLVRFRSQRSATLDELEYEFLDPLEPQPPQQNKSTKKNGLQQWMHNVSTRLDAWKERMVNQFICCGAPVLDDLDDEFEETFMEVKASSIKTLVRRPSSATAAIAPIPVITPVPMALVPPTPRQRQGTLVDISHVLHDRPRRPRSLWSVDEDIQEEEEEKQEERMEINQVQEQNEVSVENQEQAVRTIQTAFRQYKERRQAQEEPAPINHFARVRTALKCLFMMKRLTDDHKMRAARSIQQTWRRHRDQLRQNRMLTISQPRKRLRSMDEREDYHVEDSIKFFDEEEDDEELLAPVYCEEPNLLMSQLLEEHDQLFISPPRRCVSVPPPSEALKPRAIKYRALVEAHAAVKIQSLWRRVLAQHHVQALRRLTVYEQECQSVMPAIRSQMNTLRQRLHQLKSRSSSISDGEEPIEFDDDWL